MFPPIATERLRETGDGDELRHELKKDQPRRFPSEPELRQLCLDACEGPNP